MPDNNKQEFATILLQCEKGRVHDKASEIMREAVAAVKELGKPAKVSIEFTITPVKNNSRVVQIEAKPSAKIPEPPRAPSIFFADDEGGLHRNDPTQGELWDTNNTAATDGKTAAAGRD